MNIARRRFVQQGSVAVAAFGFGALARAGSEERTRLLVLLELRGGNDSLNTVVPVEDGRYFDLRPRLALGDDAVVSFDRALVLHGSLAP
jgi:uncharacterized protein (DUF1501 family)